MEACILWLHHQGTVLEYRKNKKDKWKDWKPEKGYNHVFRVKRNVKIKPES